MKINFSLNKECLPYKKTIKELYLCALNHLNIKSEIVVNVALVSDKKIQKLNKEYRNVDRVTDVLSFPMLEDINEIDTEPDFLFGECNIGDIYINLNRAKQQAEEYGHSLQREFCFLALHGFLHLLGLDHIEKEEEKEMFALQNKIMEECKICR